jgi:methyl-accepting chemotaxis protein
MNFNNLKVSVRLAAAFATLAAMLVVVAAVAWVQLNTMRHDTEEITGNWLPSVQRVGRVEAELMTFRVEELGHVLNPDMAAKAAIEKDMAAVLKHLQAERAAYEKHIEGKEERALYDSFAADWDRFHALHNQLIALSRSNATAQARALLQGDSQLLFTRMAATLDKLVELNAAGAAAAAADSATAHARARHTLLGAAVAALVLALVASLSIIRSITQPLNEAVGVANRVAEGDLTTRIDVRRQDELGVLLQALQRMQAGLVRTVGVVRGNADSVSTASAQIAQGNLDLSQRTEEQAGALQETAASMEQLGSTVRQTADNAQRANQLSQDATSIATRGGIVVADVVERMKDINESSRRIESITGVIDGIAFQTNILALNAAVEAARAGEQGRGFAVVASEVRALAQRSAEAAREIKGLIATSVQQVEQGSGLVTHAGQTMGEIVGAISKVNEIVAQISLATTEQSNGIHQVSQAVTQMDQVTQQNAALVEESAAAADSLRRQASGLVEVVAAFRLDARAVPPAANADYSVAQAGRA